MGNESDVYDAVIIGAGPGGYPCAIKMAQLGMKVACADKRKTLGGTCLNVGCIPSKRLLHTSHQYSDAVNVFKDSGINCGKVSIDVKQMMKKKDEIVSGLVKGISGLFAKNKVKQLHGVCSIDGNRNVICGDEVIKAKNIIIATGSETIALPGMKIDEKSILSSTGALSLPSVPKDMVVIGGGVIGLELGSVWQRLGCDVTVVEYLDRITPTMDLDVSKSLQAILEKQGMKFVLSTKLVSAVKSGQKVDIELESASGGDKKSMKIEKLLCSIGRRPYTDGLGLEEVGVEKDERGFVKVNERFETSIQGIFAIGDVIPGPMLAHKAEEDGIALAEILSGQAGHVDYSIIPSVIYTNPEVASIGKTEQRLKEDGIDYAVGKFPFMANSRARVVGESDGFVKMLVSKTTDQIEGVHIIGPQAGTIINELSVAMVYGATAEDIARTCHSHPDLNEAVKEAALLAYSNKTIHL